MSVSVTPNTPHDRSPRNAHAGRSRDTLALRCFTCTRALEPLEPDLALALVRQLAARLRSEATLLELVLESLEAEDGEAEGFDVAVAHAHATGRLVAASERIQ